MQDKLPGGRQPSRRRRIDTRRGRRGDAFALAFATTGMRRHDCVPGGEIQANALNGMPPRIRALTTALDCPFS